MATVLRWARLSNQRAIDNARAATTACSRRRVEREEVALYVSRRAAGLAVARDDLSPRTIA